MMADLKPCPLCGSTDIVCFAEECGDDYDNVPTFRAVVGCRGCHEEGCDPSYDDDPCFGIEAYFRADHPLIREEEDPSDCERVLERHMAERWNRRAERTCRDNDHMQDAIKCSECGEITLDTLYWIESSDGLMTVKGHRPRFCSNCGAKVVSK